MNKICLLQEENMSIFHRLIESKLYRFKLQTLCLSLLINLKCLRCITKLFTTYRYIHLGTDKRNK